jgi:homogentisate 1,2-dioxygenase
MQSFIHLRNGKTPHRLHADLDGLKDDELGRGGCTGRTANIYRRRDPTANRSVGPLRPIDVLAGEPKPSDATDANGGPLLMFSNDDCRILLSRHHEPVPFYARHVDGDLLCFVHRGTGLAETEFGPLCYREGDWIYIPKACTWRQVPDSETTLLMIEAGDEFRVPPPGALGRHFPFDPSQATIPEPALVEDAPGLGAPDEYEVRLIHRGGPTTLYYQHNPIDVEGWRGDNFAFTFNIADYNVITSDSVHRRRRPRRRTHAPVPPQRRLRPDRLLPRRFAVRRPDATGSDLAWPRGVPHGAREKARERARRKFDEHSRVDWQVIAVDTRRRLTPSAEVLAHDVGQH